MLLTSQCLFRTWLLMRYSLEESFVAFLKYRVYLVSQKRNMLLLAALFSPLIFGKQGWQFSDITGNGCSYQNLEDAHSCPLKNIFSRTPPLTGSTQKFWLGGNLGSCVLELDPTKTVGYRALASTVVQSLALNTWFEGVSEVCASNLCLCQYLHAHIEGEFSPHLKMIYDPKRLTITSIRWIRPEKKRLMKKNEGSTFLFLPFSWLSCAFFLVVVFFHSHVS